MMSTFHNEMKLTLLFDKMPNFTAPLDDGKTANREYLQYIHRMFLLDLLSLIFFHSYSSLTQIAPSIYI